MSVSEKVSRLDDDGDGTVPQLPGEDLTTEQREAARLGLEPGYTNARTAEEVGVCERTVDRWRALPAYRRYVNSLVQTLVQEEGAKARAVLARGAVKAATKLAEHAGGEKPHSPYAVDAQRSLLDRVTGKPGADPVELGVRVPTEHGDVVIVWRSKE